MGLALRSLTIREEIEVTAPVGAVWDLFRDLEAWPQWNPVCRGASWVRGPSWVAGSTFRMRLRIAGVPVPFMVQVVEDDLPWAVAWSATIMGVTGRRQFQFDFQGRKSIIIDTETVTSRYLPLRLFYPRPIVRAMSRAWLRALKREVERRGPQTALVAGPRGW
ncbi:MAG: SRPBCC family protein [Chloroflexi bacterium]|nr:SRPBCC family protein [Chloroflexota bacterium]